MLELEAKASQGQLQMIRPADSELYLLNPASSSRSLAPRCGQALKKYIQTTFKNTP